MIRQIAEQCGEPDLPERIYQACLKKQANSSITFKVDVYNTARTTLVGTATVSPVNSGTFS